MKAHSTRHRIESVCRAKVITHKAALQPSAYPLTPNPHPHPSQHRLAKGFVEKMMMMNQPLRQTITWRKGGTLAAQDSFAPTLLARMEQANVMGKTAMVSTKVDEIKELMAGNIELLLQRGDHLETLERKTHLLGKMAKTFHRSSRRAKRFKLWQQAKLGVTTGAAVAVGVGVMAVPAILAL